MNKSITAHCLVRNEERWVWYAIMSVIEYVDKILVFDTGSTDRTVEIVKSIKSPKIIFEEKGIVGKKGFTGLRQEMLDRTETEWFMVLDGDEVWTKVAIEALMKAIGKAKAQERAVIVGHWACVGDVWHYSQIMEELINPQAPLGLKGWRSARGMRKFPGLQTTNSYPLESYVDEKGVNASEWERKRLIFIKEKFFHMTFLRRSATIKQDRQVMMRGPKIRFVKGRAFSEGMEYPEVFHLARPKIVPDPWGRLNWGDQVRGVYYRGLNAWNRYIRKRNT